MSEQYHLPTNDELPMDRLTQMAMWGYIDGAQQNGHAHDRLVRASRGAVLGVLEVLREQGILRTPIQREAVHGTAAGASAGCRCEFCREADALIARARYRWTKKQGHNKVRA